jgi:signal transduction histidine kinase
VVALTNPRSQTGVGPLVIGLNLVSIAFIVWGITSEAHLGFAGRRLAVLLLLVAAVAGWGVWLRVRPNAGPPAAVSLMVMALAGGALAAFAPLALTFVGVAALGAAVTWPPERAAIIAAAGPVAMLISLPGAGHVEAAVLSGLAAALAGAVMGISRRQSLERAEQAALVQVSEARAEAERARAELLAGRNHLARELHDVLAHTLSALSLQLQALDALMIAGPPVSPEVRDQLEQIKRLVKEGLDEARGAVQALREDALPLEEQLARLAQGRGADLSVAGAPRPLRPEVVLTLYRVAQEALTNVVKHAPGARAEVGLRFEDEQVTVSVANDDDRRSPPPSLLAESGGGYGIQGIRERVLLVGGSVEAGPTEGGWLVRARVPG